MIGNSSGILEYVGIALLMIVLPAVLNIVITMLFKKFNLIKDGDMKLKD